MTTRMAASEYRKLAMAGWDEGTFLTEVVAAAAARGWLCFHARPAMLRNGRYVTAGQGAVHGFPDLCLAKEGRVILAELKSETGKLTDRQKDWIEASGGMVWRPSMWDQILEVLDGAQLGTDERIGEGDASAFEGRS